MIKRYNFLFFFLSGRSEKFRFSLAVSGEEKSPLSRNAIQVGDLSGGGRTRTRETVTLPVCACIRLPTRSCATRRSEHKEKNIAEESAKVAARKLGAYRRSSSVSFLPSFPSVPLCSPTYSGVCIHLSFSLFFSRSRFLSPLSTTDRTPDR